MPKQQDQGLTVDLGAEARVRLEGFQFRAEQQHLALPTVVERLFAQAVAGQVKHLVMAIPEGKGKHTDEFLQGFADPEGFHRREQRLGVGVTAPAGRFRRHRERRAAIGGSNSGCCGAATPASSSRRMSQWL